MTSNAVGGASPGSGYAAQVETLRSAARWLLAAAAGVGALLVGGLQLTGIGRLPLGSWRLHAALGAAALALVSVGYMIKVASTVLTQEWLTLADFLYHDSGLPGPWGNRRRADRQTEAVREYLAASRHELFAHVAATLPELNSKLQESHEAMWRANLDEVELQRAAEKSNELRRAARDVVEAANYYYVLHLFKRLRVRTAWAAVVVVACMIVFAYATDPSPTQAPQDVRIVPTRPAGP
jgi:hypothetical protein